MQHGQKELWEEDAQPWERFKFQAPRVVEPGKLSNDWWLWLREVQLRTTSPCPGVNTWSSSRTEPSGPRSDFRSSYHLCPHPRSPMSWYPECSTVRIVTDLKNKDWRNIGYRYSTKRHQGVSSFFPVSMGREVKAVCTNIVSFSIYTGKALNFWSTLSFGNSTGSKTFRGQGIFSTAAGVEFSLKKKKINRKFRNLAIKHWL